MTVTSQELQKQTHNTKRCQFKQNIITMMMTAFEKDLFVAVISEENDTGKETIYRKSTQHSYPSLRTSI